LAGSIGDYCPKAISGLAVTLDEASAAFKRAYDTMRECPTSAPVRQI
jgi:hypothetical protein